MDKGKGVMGSLGRRWGVDFTDNSTSSRDIPDPPGFSRASLDQDDSSLSRQKKDAESNWKAQDLIYVIIGFNYMMWETESLGSSTSPFEELANDGVHDVDGR
ncbi:putative ER membrane protein complex subunit 4-like [Sesbania bispinosa]|nr:putative ER membrane protein complex subunit 4-like [Sesbania bispinosa]